VPLPHAPQSPPHDGPLMPSRLASACTASWYALRPQRALALHPHDDELPPGDRKVKHRLPHGRVVVEPRAARHVHHVVRRERAALVVPPQQQVPRLGVAVHAQVGPLPAEVEPEEQRLEGIDVAIHVEPHDEVRRQGLPRVDDAATVEPQGDGRPQLAPVRRRVPPRGEAVAVLAAGTHARARHDRQHAPAHVRHLRVARHREEREGVGARVDRVCDAVEHPFPRADSGRVAAGETLADRGGHAAALCGDGLRGLGPHRELGKGHGGLAIEDGSAGLG
jgi:hypothetical protein